MSRASGLLYIKIYIQTWCKQKSLIRLFLAYLIDSRDSDTTAPDVDGLEVHDNSSKVLFLIAHEGYTVLIEELGRLRLAIGTSNTSPLFHEVHLAEVFRYFLQWESRLGVKDRQLAVVTENALYGITLGCL